MVIFAHVVNIRDVSPSKKAIEALRSRLESQFSIKGLVYLSMEAREDDRW